MEKFKTIVKKYNMSDLFLIFVFSLVLFVIFYAKQDAYLVDVGREAYIPWQMLEGKVLYKDIFNVYGPLGYQINAFAYAILGINLNTLYLMGFLNSLLICFTTFFTVKLFSSRKIALCTTALTMAVCIYIRTFFNFIFAYSYSAVYALSGFLLSLFCALLYIKDKKIKYLMLSFLFAGFSFANKVEDLPYFVFLFICLPFFLGKEYRTDWKKYLKVIGAFLVFPILSFGILLLQGAAFSDFVNAFDLINRLVKAPATEYFYNAYGLYFNPFYIKLSFHYLFKLLQVSLPCALMFYGLNYLNMRFVESRFLKSVVNTGVGFFLLAVAVLTYKRALPVNVKLFCWLGMCGAIVLLGFGIWAVLKYFKNKTPIETKDKMFMFLLASSLLVSIKGIWGITTECYGTFSLAALFMPFVIFFAVYPKRIKFVEENVLEKTIQNLCFIAVISSLCINTDKIFTSHLYPVQTDRGVIMVREVFKSQNELVNFIKTNTPKDAQIVSVPEGAIINFLASRNSNNFYYYLIPVNVQVFGEEKILSDFKKNMPDYFIMNNVPYTPFNVGNFCSFAPNVCKFIESNYTQYASVDDGVGFVLYKKNLDVK